MQNLAPLLTPNQAAYALSINPHTLSVLVTNGIIPHTYIQDNDLQELRFNPYILDDWLQTKPKITLKNEESISSLREYYKSQHPDTIQSLKTFDNSFAAKQKAKGYSLAKVPSKKYGFLYYVRYIEKGRLIYSRWNTHTKDRAAAEQFAVENREKILNAYYAKRQPQSSDKNLYHILNNYYKPDSPYFDEARKRGRVIKEATQKMYHRWTRNVLAPFLRDNRITSFDDITPPLIAKMQNKLLAKGLKPQTINQGVNGMSAVFRHMVMNGVIAENVFNKISPLKENQSSKTRACYAIEKITGVFNVKWHEEIEYLLCLLIYTTGMRNSEIEKIRPQDIIKIGGCHFVNIPDSKTVNGIRIVPLHPFVLEKLTSFIKKRDISKDSYILPVKGRPSLYQKATTTLCRKLHRKLGIKPEEAEEYLSAQYITFYSGRHFWKTLMNANDLGDIEEYFMGHRVSNDVAKRYNHRDKQGQETLLKKARKVYAILDRWVFKQ